MLDSELLQGALDGISRMLLPEFQSRSVSVSMRCGALVWHFTESRRYFYLNAALLPARSELRHLVGRSFGAWAVMMLCCG